jgi:hypothetical protein
MELLVLVFIVAVGVLSVFAGVDSRLDEPRR